MTATMRRESWGVGPWIDEPNELHWSHDGRACRALRNSYGAWCGYVAVEHEHPWHGLGYDELPDELHEVHGGLTFASVMHRRSLHEALQRTWWIGFDCAHAYDYVPGIGPFVGLGRDVHAYRALPYVKAECERLADQVTAAAAAPGAKS